MVAPVIKKFQALRDYALAVSVFMRVALPECEELLAPQKVADVSFMAAKPVPAKAKTVILKRVVWF